MDLGSCSCFWGICGYHVPGLTRLGKMWKPLLASRNANSVEECAIKLATFQTEKGETVSASALRFRVLMSRFDSAVERQPKAVRLGPR